MRRRPRPAHGYLALSRLTRLCQGLLAVDGTKMAISCGLNRARFPATCRQAHASASATLVGVGGGIQVLIGVTVECEDSAKPMYLAQTVSRFHV